ncbi:anion permease [Paraburkholderia sp. HD33-4]|uniref:anion permease n=1 Tax=Paraburkholderia sp. HD33-4 TaxID=2883242 RepID=UPI001F37566C|nr:anion permease [Paraburkholderia sp. HD33-4]
MKTFWKAVAPLIVAIVIGLIPAPPGLAQHAWYYFAIFAGVIVGLMLEPIPGAAIGLIAVTLVAVFSEWVFFSLAQLARPNFNVANASLGWAPAVKFEAAVGPRAVSDQSPIVSSKE